MAWNLAKEREREREREREGDRIRSQLFRLEIAQLLKETYFYLV